MTTKPARTRMALAILGITAAAALATAVPACADDHANLVPASVRSHSGDLTPPDDHAQVGGDDHAQVAGDDHAQVAGDDHANGGRH
ncbi:hypothetical protein [Streptomyces sp. NPDC051162]|uniref:hypothetical protein n=1 Tax=Streptomyces sp. NPDC051162 TaxID=3154747 RepID=UPI0034242247